MSIHPDVERIALLGWRVAPATRLRAGMFKGYIDAASCDLDQIERWHRLYPGSNWVVVPQGSGVFAMDLDRPGADHQADGVTAMARLQDQHGRLPQTTLGRSGGGGCLLVFKDEGARLCRATGTPEPGIDPRSGRCVFTVSPSVHKRGGAYRWVRAPWECTPLPAPKWLLHLLKPRLVAPAPKPADLDDTRVKIHVTRALDKVFTTREGGRNDQLNKSSYRLGTFVQAGKLSESNAFDLLLQAACAVGLSQPEAVATIRSGLTSARRGRA